LLTECQLIFEPTLSCLPQSEIFENQPERTDSRKYTADDIKTNSFLPAS